MVKHNNAISQVHFRKDWERHVYTWFDQGPQKRVRRLKRQRKAVRVFPRPVKGLLRPIVRCPSAKYNTHTREGYGFTHEELKAAGINRKGARQIGIAVDKRRRNKTNSSFEPNVERLKTYMSKLVLWPRRVSHSKLRNKSAELKEKETKLKKEGKSDTPAAKTVTATVQKKKKIQTPQKQVKRALSIPRSKAKVEWRVIEDYERLGPGAYVTMVSARSEARKVGKKKKAEAEAAAELAFKK